MSIEKIETYWNDYVKEITKWRPAEESIFFLISEHPFYKWRPVASLSKELKITQDDTLIYLKNLLAQKKVIQHPNNPDYWGAPNRVCHLLEKSKEVLIMEDDGCLNPPDSTLTITEPLHVGLEGIAREAGNLLQQSKTLCLLLEKMCT